MKYLLDTNICIHLFRGKFNLLERIENSGLTNCAISEITLAELIFGAENSSNPSKNHRISEKFIGQITILPIFSAIRRYGKEKVRFRRSGNMISDFDLLIGCTALENEMIMVTENRKEFERINGITIENWTDRKK